SSASRRWTRTCTRLSSERSWSRWGTQGPTASGAGESRTAAQRSCCGSKRL
ncbi:unnamed protein product, partial [Ectocarpus sp. 13 AM-2016]